MNIIIIIYKKLRIPFPHLSPSLLPIVLFFLLPELPDPFLLAHLTLERGSREERPPKGTKHDRQPASKAAAILSHPVVGVVYLNNFVAMVTVTT